MERKQSFLEKKFEVLKRAKKWTFEKGLVHGFCPKIELSVIAVFYRNYVRKDGFSLVLKENNHFLDPKIEGLNRAKKWIFFTGVSPSILSKNRTFSYRRFSQKSYQKRSFLILWKEKNDFKKKKLKF